MDWVLWVLEPLFSSFCSLHMIRSLFGSGKVRRAGSELGFSRGLGMASEKLIEEFRMHTDGKALESDTIRNSHRERHNDIFLYDHSHAVFGEICLLQK